VILILSAALALLAALILLYSLALMTGKVLQRVRARHHVGEYRVRIGAPDARGFDGIDLENDFVSVAEAKVGALEALLKAADSTDVAFVLARRDDGEWDVVDRVDVLS
jgi:hypothetical protein